MKIVGIIPSRYESSRFPGKPLVELKGKTMIQRVVEQAQKSSLLDEVIVATDHEEIFDHVDAFGNVIMTSSDHKSGTDRCAEVAKNHNADIIINIQGDEPLIHPEQIDQLCRLMQEDDVQIGTLIKVFENESDFLNPNRIKVVISEQKKALYFSRSPIPHGDFETSNIKRWRHIGLYGYKAETLFKITKLEPSALELQEKLEQLRWLENGYSIHVAPTTMETPNIDTPEDVRHVLALLES